MNLNKRTILITGAYGFIGRHIAKFMFNKGARVIGIGHGIWKKSEWESWGLSEWYVADITLDNLILSASKPDVIFHCASGSSVPLSISNPMLDFERSINSTLAILNFMRIQNFDSCLVLPSSAAVYGLANEGLIKEDEELNPISPYGLHKKIKEELCVFYSKLYKLKIAIVRLFSVYGPGMRKQLLWEACSSLHKNEKIFAGTGTETRDWIHVNDAVNLLSLAANYSNINVPIVNGGCGKAVKVKNILDLISGICKIPPPQFSGIKRPGDPFHLQADISKVKSWGWKPEYSWENGVKEYVEWFKNNEKN
jgi:UDP-glucose 4-epimerase